MDFVFKNAMENLVLQRLDDMIDKLECCKCEQCRMDIAAYALNHLPPKYVATKQGELFMKVDALTLQHSADVTAAIVAAAALIRDHPRHKPVQALVKDAVPQASGAVDSAAN